MSVVIERAKATYRSVVRRYPAIDALRVNRLVLGNMRPLGINLRYLEYLIRCRRAYRGLNGATVSPTIREAARHLRVHGYYIFSPPADLSTTRMIAHRMEALIQSGRTAVASGLEEWMIQVPQCVKEIPELSQLLRPEIVATLERYFGCYFKIYCFEVYRLVPTHQPPQLSGLWHLDNYPVGMLKVMVYLTDCDDATGALRVHPRPSTRRLIRRGFFDRYRAEPFVEQLNRDHVPLEGPAGAVVLWDPNLVHRGTPPQVGYRDAASFKLVPSMEPWDRHLARMGAQLSDECRKNAAPDDPSAD